MTGDRPAPAAMRSTAPPAADPKPDGPLSFATVVAEESRYLELADDAPRAALCLSGGGIRSAAFALGVVTGLARAGVLDAFHYLSTVSGGGYTGSWLSAWFQRAGARRPDPPRPHADPTRPELLVDDHPGRLLTRAGLPRVPSGPPHGLRPSRRPP